MSDQSAPRKRYLFIPRTLIFAIRGPDVLLIRGAPDKPLWPNQYNGIGGHVEVGEDILSAARREFLEETGLKLESEHLCAVITTNTGNEIGILIFVFIGKCINGDLVESKEGKLGWFPLQKLFELDLVEDLYTLLPKILASKPGMDPFYVQYFYDNQDQLIIQFSSRNLDPLDS